MPEKLDVCKPFVRNNGKIIYPCGKIANSFPRFNIFIDNKEINDNGIIWGSQKNFIKPTTYNLNEITPPISWPKNTNLKNLNQNNRFVNWINIAAFDNFRKLHGKTFLKKGNHNISVTSDNKFNNDKLVLAQTSAFGVKNLFLSVSLLILGIFSFISSIFLLNTNFWGNSE